MVIGDCTNNYLTITSSLIEIESKELGNEYPSITLCNSNIINVKVQFTWPPYILHTYLISFTSHFFSKLSVGMYPICTQYNANKQVCSSKWTIKSESHGANLLSYPDDQGLIPSLSLPKCQMYWDKKMRNTSWSKTFSRLP